MVELKTALLVGVVADVISSGRLVRLVMAPGDALQTASFTGPAGS